MIMMTNCSGFDVSRASWEFPEGTCAGYNGEKQPNYDDDDDDFDADAEADDVSPILRISL